MDWNQKNQMFMILGIIENVAKPKTATLESIFWTFTQLNPKNKVPIVFVNLRVLDIIFLKK